MIITNGMYPYIGDKPRSLEVPRRAELRWAFARPSTRTERDRRSCCRVVAVDFVIIAEDAPRLGAKHSTIPSRSEYLMMTAYNNRRMAANRTGNR